MYGKRLFSLLLGGLLSAVVILACSSNDLKKNLSMRERMEYAMKKFDEGDYMDAKTHFRILTLSHSGGSEADKAQFYLGECHYEMNEYILAASEYKRLISVFPNSEYVDDAKFKLGMSYFELSPKYSLDQEYTHQAIRQFQEFLEEYTSSDLIPQVENRLEKARLKLAHKVYSSAVQYRKMGEYRAAIIYFNRVLEQYYDTQYAPQAQYWIGECYRKQKKYEEAKAELERFLDKYPKHELQNDAQEKLADVIEELNERREEESDS
jgi:outer membrane protein assembly factor BamD